MPGVRSLRHPSRQRRRLCGPPPAVPLSTQRGTLGAAEGSGLVGGRGPPTPPTEPCAGRRPPRAAVAPRGAAGAADRALRAPRSGGRPRQGGGPDRGTVLDQQGVRVEAATGRCSSAAAVRRPGLGPRASLGPSKGRVGPARGAFRVEGPVLDHQGGRAGRPLRPWSPSGTGPAPAGLRPQAVSWTVFRCSSRHAPAAVAVTCTRGPGDLRSGVLDRRFCEAQGRAGRSARPVGRAPPRGAATALPGAAGLRGGPWTVLLAIANRVLQTGPIVVPFEVPRGIEGHLPPAICAIFKMGAVTLTRGPANMNIEIRRSGEGET